MKLTDLKKRVTYAVRALKGVPMIEDCPVPKLIVEAPHVQTIQACVEVYQKEADMVGPEIVGNRAKRRLLEEIVKGLDKSGCVQITQKKTSTAFIYRARIRVVSPREEG